MIGKTSPPILKQTLTPVILVIIFWLTMSLMTTYFIVWVEKSNQRVFDENVISTTSARRLQVAVWKLAAEFPDSIEKLAGYQSEWMATRPQVEFELRPVKGALARQLLDDEAGHPRCLPQVAFRPVP